MKRKMLGLIIGFLLIGFNVCAADGDLIVNGMVGVGTSSPATKLDVSGTIRSTGFSTPTGGTGVEIRYDSNNSKGFISTQSRPSGAFGYLEIIGNPLILNGTVVNKVGIGNTNPGYLLTMEASGGGYYNQSTHAWVNGSSGRWKSSVKPITGALDAVLKLNGVSFKWKKRTDIFEDSIEGTKKYISSAWSDDPDGRDDIGLVGEDVMEVLPEVVDIDKTDSNFVTGVNYAKIVPLLIEAIKEQQNAIDKLRGELETLKSK